MAPIEDASAPSLLHFVKESIGPGTTVIMDGWNGYLGIENEGYIHDRRRQRAARVRGEVPDELQPAVHRIPSPTKRWILDTGGHGCCPLAKLSQRVRVPVQPPAFTPPRDAVLPHPGTCRSPYTGAVQGSGRRPAAHDGVPQTPNATRASEHSGEASPEPAMEAGHKLRLNEEPGNRLCR